MTDNPDFVTVGMLIGQPARAAMLLELLDGRGRTATELADAAETTRSTASFHLSQLVDGHILRVDKQGRHRYFRLAGPEIAELLESLLVVAERPRAPERRFGPRHDHIRQARMCYDHIAGTLGIGIVDGLIRADVLVEGSDCFHLTQNGERALSDFGIDIAATRRKRRYFARTCVDWSERRPHLAGALGAAIAERMFVLNWIQRDPDGRAIYVTPEGQRGLSMVFDVGIANNELD